MKQKIISLFILILVSACSPSAPAPTVAMLPTSTNTSLPTETPTPIPTKTPFPTESLIESIPATETIAKFSDSKTLSIDQNGNLVLNYEAESGTFTDFTLHENGVITVKNTEGQEVQIDASSLKIDEVFNKSHGKVYTHDIRLRMKDKAGNPWEFHNGKFNQVDFVITTNTKDFESIPSITLEELTSSDFVKKVLGASDQGRFMKRSNEIKTVKSILFYPDINDKFVNEYGMGPVFNLTLDDRNNGEYLNHPEYIPQTMVAVFKFEYAGAKANLIITRWENSDNPNDVGFIGHIFLAQDKNNPNAMQYEIIQRGIGSGERITTNMYFIRDSNSGDGCAKYLDTLLNDKNHPFCQWYYNNPQIVLPKEIYRNWQKTGILSNITPSGIIMPISFMGAVSIIPSGE